MKLSGYVVPPFCKLDSKNGLNPPSRLGAGVRNQSHNSFGTPCTCSLAFIYFLGCEVYGHDHTVHARSPSQRLPGLHTYQLGVGTSDTGRLRTLDSLLRANGHLGTTVHYLKADIEGDELDVVPQWIDR